MAQTVSRAGSRLLGGCLAIGLGLLASKPASAECRQSYTGSQLVEDLGAMTVAMRELDVASFRAAGTRLEGNLACVKNPVLPTVFASAYRYIGAYHHLTGDPDGARRWFRSSLEIDPTFDWDINDLEQGHPLRVTFDAERAVANSDPTPVEGMVLNLPAGSRILIDGRTLDAPEATLERPHIVQIVGTADNSVRQVYLIDGNNFPSKLMRSETELPVDVVAVEEETARKRRERRGVTPEIAYGDVEVVDIERVRPAAKTPLLVGGGLAVLGSGALYALSFSTHSDFLAARNTDDLLKARTVTNTLVIASGAAFATGIGVGIAGIQMGAGPGLVLGGHF